MVNDAKARMILLSMLTVCGSALGMELGLAEALEMSRMEHPEAEIARAQLAEIEAMEAMAKVPNYPHLSARVNYLQTTNPMHGFGAILNQGTFNNTIDFNNPGQMDALSGSLDAQYRIYSGGERKALRHAARHARTSSEHQLNATESGLEDAVVRAYFEIRQADDVVRSVESGIEVLEENLRISRIREASGDLIRTERLNLEVELAALNRELLAHRNQARIARMRMAWLIGRSPDTEIELEAGDPSITRIVPPGSDLVRDRPELLAMRELAMSAREGTHAASAMGKPTMDAYASWQGDKGWRREGDGESWTAGIVLNVPIFDGFRARSEVARAKARERVAAENLRRTELTLQMELEQARLAYDLAREQKGVAEKQVSQAEEAARLSREKFSVGTLLSTELMGVENRLTDSRVQLAVATSQEYIALAHLRRVSGLPILENIK